MNEEEARSTYHRVASSLLKTGLKWVVEEVEDAAAEGVAEEIVPSLSAHSLERDIISIWKDAGTFRQTVRTRTRRGKETRTRYRQATALERLELLRKALRAVLVDIDNMVRGATTELGIKPEKLVFRPDQPEGENEFSRSTHASFEASASLLSERQRELIELLLKEMGN